MIPTRTPAASEITNTFIDDSFENRSSAAIGLRKIEQQQLGRVARGFHAQLRFALERSAIACIQRFVVERHCAASDLQPGLAAARQQMLNLVAELQARGMEPNVLVDDDRAI